MRPSQQRKPGRASAPRRRASNARPSSAHSFAAASSGLSPACIAVRILAPLMADSSLPGKRASVPTPASLCPRPRLQKTLSDRTVCSSRAQSLRAREALIAGASARARAASCDVWPSAIACAGQIKRAGARGRHAPRTRCLGRPPDGLSLPRTASAKAASGLSVESAMSRSTTPRTSSASSEHPGGGTRRKPGTRAGQRGSVRGEKPSPCANGKHAGGPCDGASRAPYRGGTALP